MKSTLAIFMAAIAVVHMEPQWPLLQPTVPYVYGAYPVYHQVRVVPWTKSVASLAYSFKAKNGLENLSAEGCSVVTEFQEGLKYIDDFFEACDVGDDGIQPYEWFTTSCQEFLKENEGKYQSNSEDESKNPDLNGDGRITHREFVRLLNAETPDECVLN